MRGAFHRIVSHAGFLAFVGHWLEEYSALASITDVPPLSSLVDIVFYRGITMRGAVERDL